jgi:uncharacterized membrane protein YdjX (TVP38/TMEM64 family)
MRMPMLRELAGLFVDDGALAIAVCAVVAFAAAVSVLAPGVPIAAGMVLLFGCLVALVGNTMAARKR